MIYLGSRRSTLSLKTIVSFGIGIVLLICASILYVHLSPNANAMAISGFKAGDIMSNAVMSNKSTLSESQIQSFLKSKNSCNKPVSGSGVHVYSSTRAYTKGTLNGKSAIWWWNIKGGADGHFVCMADDTFSGQSAAHVIYRAAQDYNINPQVLIVLLQKEQGLITDQWPNDHQYAAATGYDCPDTPSGCNNDNGGFITQVRKAASLFHSVLTGGWSNYPVGDNVILYNPNSSCGSSHVNILNEATSALYRYTPYQPNSATLKAGWPSPGVSCGAYGNLNFYMYFTTWFGPTDGYVSLDTPRWMVLNRDVQKIDLRTGDPVENTLTKGTQLTFTTKIKLNGVWYLRTQFDSERYLPKVIPLSAISEIQYTPNQTTTWRQLSKDSSKINPVTGKSVENFKKGTQFQVAGQITVSGVTYLRTVFDSGRDTAAAFSSSDVTDIPYSSLPNPHWMVLNKDTKKIDPITGTADSNTQAKGTQAFVDNTITVGNVQYLRIQTDTQSNTALALPATSLDEIPYTTLPQATWMNLKPSTVKYDPTTGEVVGQDTQNLNQLQFASSITVNGKKYLRTAFDTEHKLNKGVLESDVEAIQYVPLQEPRNFSIKDGMYKIVPSTGVAVKPYVRRGDVLFFDTKMYVNGIWYLRSQYDTAHNYDKGIPLSQLQDTKIIQ